MADTLRTRWQKFKAKYPDFEKSKLYKADLGPRLDKWDEAKTKARAARDAYLKSLELLMVEIKGAAQIANAYKLVAKELKTKHPKIEEEFSDVFEFDVKFNVEPIMGVAISECQKLDGEAKAIKF